MWENKRKIITLSLAVLVLVGSATVLGLTVVRIQNQKPTVSLPKATGSEGACTGTLQHWYVDNKSDCTKAKYGADPCDAPCFWDPPKCASSANTCWCPADPNVYKPYDCSQLKDEQTCNAKDNGISGYVPAKRESCIWATLSGGCWVKEPIPKSWNSSSLSWDWDTTWSSTISQVMVYVWTSSARAGGAYSTAAASSSDGFKSVKISDFHPSLAASTTYYVKVNPNSYSSPDPAKYQCMDTATSGWSFTTPADLGSSGATGMTAACSSPYTQANLSWTPPVWANRAFLSVKDTTSGTNIFSENNVTYTQKNVPTTPGHSYTWVVGEQGGPGQYVSADGPPFTCAGGGTACSSGKTQCGTSCVDLQTDAANCGGCGLACKTSESCLKGVCTPGNNEANQCWGNNGVNGRCYDCNGDGTVNVLDFSCFRNRFGQTVP